MYPGQVALSVMVNGGVVGVVGAVLLAGVILPADVAGNDM